MELPWNDFDEDEKRTASRQTPLYSFISGNRRDEGIDGKNTGWDKLISIGFCVKIRDRDAHVAHMEHVSRN